MSQHLCDKHGVYDSPDSPAKSLEGEDEEEEEMEIRGANKRRMSTEEDMKPV